MPLPVVNSAEGYKTLLSRNTEYCGNVEFICINCLFSNYLSRVHYENNPNIADYGTGSIVCQTLFSGNCDAEHFGLL